MKTAISIPDDLFESADSLAERLAISRSQLYARAVEEYLAKHKDQHVTNKLNEVLAEADSSLTPQLRRAQARSVKANDW
jgi:metal-responsive CopG/Arc/MetJ family transcriptional regulator